ncbi:winged helix DNA-binding domain-containing protein, partial [Atractiella rhizophila]
RPALSFPEMIAIVLTSSPEGKASISTIFSTIQERWPFFTTAAAPKSWRNTCRNVLSTHRCFRKIPRGSNETGKGDFWCLI